MKSRFFPGSSVFLKSIPALVVVALSSATSEAASKYWDLNGTTSGLGTGAGTWDLSSTNWNTATAGTAATVAFISGDDAFFQTGGVNTVTLGANLTVNSITQTANSTATTINSGAGTQLTITAGKIDSTGNQPLIINPDVVLSAAGPITTSLSTNPITLVGIVSGTGFTKAGTGTLNLNGANTYTGTTNVIAGTVNVVGATANINSSTAITLGGAGIVSTLVLDNTAGISDRLKDTAPVSLSAGGALSLVGNATTNTSESIGALTLGSGGSTLTISGTAAGLQHTLLVPSVSRTNFGTGLVRGTSLGQSATNSTLLTLADTSGLNFVGTTTASGTSPGTAKNVKIVPWLIGDAGATGPGVNFVTYDTVAGLRPLGSTEYVTLTAGYAGTGENVKGFNGTITAPGPNLNSLLFSAANTLDGSGDLNVASGAVALINSSVAAIGSGFSSLSLGNNEGVIWVNSTGSLTINPPVSVSGGGGLIKAGGGTGALILNGVNTYTGPTTVNQGVLTIGTGGSTTASSAVTVKSGGTFNVNTGATVNGSVTAQISTGQNTVNVVNSGTIAGALTTIAGTGPASPNANSTPIVFTGHAQLNASSSTGAITNNGQLTLTGVTAITAIGTISGSGGNGGFNDANIDTKTLNLAAGSSFSYFRPTNTTGTATSILQVVGSGTTGFQWFGYNNAVGGTADVTFNGGTFNIGKIGQNNTGATTIGNYTVTNGTVINVATAGHEHGTWNITNGTMAFTGSIAQANGTTAAASSFQVTVSNAGIGSGSTFSATGSLTLGHAGGGSSIQDNFLTIGNGGTASFTSGLLAIGNAQAATSETNTVNLNGGKLLVGGVTGIAAGAGTGQTNKFNWTGGQLSALQITPSVKFTAPVSGGITTTGLINSGGVLAPGGAGVPGQTRISGDYTQQAGGTLAIDIGGTVQTGAFQNAVNSYDNVLLSGATANLSLSGALQVSLQGFTPANTDTFDIIRATPSSLVVSGAFSNVAFGSRITTQGGEGSFLLTNTGGVITLSDYQAVASNTYASWIGGFSVGGLTAAGDDFDNDGLSNVVENILGSSPAVSNTGLTQISATGSTFKFRHNESNTIASDVSKTYQWSTNLTEWKSSGQTNTGGTTATITESIITDNLAPANDLIEVTVAVSGGPATKVFARLVATKTP